MGAFRAMALAFRFQRSWASLYLESVGRRLGGFVSGSRGDWEDIQRDIVVNNNFEEYSN